MNKEFIPLPTRFRREASILETPEMISIPKVRTVIYTNEDIKRESRNEQKAEDGDYSPRHNCGISKILDEKVSESSRSKKPHRNQSC